MQASTRNRDLQSNGASFSTRARGHAPHLSISDDSHHVTETIGFLYGNEEERDGKRASNVPSRAQGPLDPNRSEANDALIHSQQQKYYQNQTRSNGKGADLNNGQQPNTLSSARDLADTYPNGAATPPITISPSREQSPHDTAQSRFPLTDIDYESSPAAVAQELSNLQALRRMSMDVHAAGDPDLPSLNPAAIPSSPTSSDDASQLFWVPARLHPELAPKEFKTFLESKAEQIKRRSGDLSTLSGSSFSSRSGSLSSNATGLSRQKSMLSREVNNPSSFRDGADLLEHRRSLSARNQPADPNLADIESLVANSVAAQRPESPEATEDFILPSVPASSLKRSTKTKYQRHGGGLKGRGDRAQRGGRRAQTPDQEPSPSQSTTSSPIPNLPPQFASFVSSDSPNLADTLSLPAAKNFSRPVARSPSPPQDQAGTPITPTFDSILASTPANNSSPSSSISNGRPSTSTSAQAHPEIQITPQIIEPPSTDETSTPVADVGHESRIDDGHQQNTTGPQQRHPARTSSRETSRIAARPPVPRTHSSANNVPKQSRVDVPPLTNPKQSLEQPSPLPGNDTNTSNLSFIPTMNVTDRPPQEKKESKKSSWGWLLGKDDDKGKGKGAKSPQAHDGTRLDLLQTSIEGSSKRRETIELDRDSMRLEEERKKESNRKTSAAEKKEKDSIFSSLFSSKKSKAEKEAKKSPYRLSPEPRSRELKPDVDYSWTRFSILEERAIYRMAHIKLANPRRPLHSQVLLSNFMYSYLAKVQQMHPQMNLPTSAKAQKRQKEQPSRNQQQQQQQQSQSQSQSEEFNTYQRYQQQQQQQEQQSQPQPQQQQQSPVQHQSEAYSQPGSQEGPYEGQYASDQYDYSQSRSHRAGSRDMDYNQGTGQYSNHNSYHRSQHQIGVQEYETDREHETWDR